MILSKPDKTLDCYPCYCSDCPGYHMCDFYYQNLNYEQEASCEVCGRVVRYAPFIAEDIEKSETVVPQSTKTLFYEGRPVGGKCVTLIKPYK